MDIRFKKAVALRYRSELAAPLVVAKGKGILAKKIIETAMNGNIPVIENKDLAELLFKIDIGNYIPPELYKAVAEVLIFIKKLEKEV
ncbi:MAG: EscU/YscU/HrcU family type III secretion system export apparatus switch protein [Thermoanaerobacteraceae bacterium]|nr:EscU/YscU/HrcU family type III secretion system export apparatus switch protein [Thermoanaerobacteraceae bacterium]